MFTEGLYVNHDRLKRGLGTYKKTHKHYRATRTFAKHVIWHFSHCVCNKYYFRKSTGITKTVIGIWTCLSVNFHFSNAVFKYFSLDPPPFGHVRCINITLPNLTDNSIVIF